MAPLLKRAVGRALASLGYTIVPTWRFSRIREAAHARQLFEFLDIDCVIDVGANVGQYVEFVRHHVGYQGLIVSVEPITALHQRLTRASANDPRWEVRRLALGRTAGEARFNVTANSEFSSILPIDRDAYDFGAMTEITETIQVEVGTLDALVPEIRQRFGIRNIHLKLDTQGYDVEVLAGAARVLDGIASVQTEMAVRRIYDGMPDFREASRYLEEHGFVISQVFPGHEEHFPVLVDFDCYALHHSRMAGTAGRRA